MRFMNAILRLRAVLAVGMALVLGLLPAVVDASAVEHDDSYSGKPGGKYPNILFFIMDDVGIDQMKAFGYGGATPPHTPNIDAIAKAGARFRNTWSMPECSPSRAEFFEGRFSFRTQVLNAILAKDLANSQVSPFEVTTPEILRRRGYESGLFGKFHLSGMDNNPYGNGVVTALGWDYFAGYLAGAPFPIDTTAGGVVKPNDQGVGPYSCGFVPNASDDSQNGADTGACYVDGGSSCTQIDRGSDIPTPGRACLDRGGIFVPKQSCQPSPPSAVTEAFRNNQNAYYVSQLVIDTKNRPPKEIPLTDPRARVYRTTIESDLAIDWVKDKRRQPKKLWMATVAYSSAHAPYQQPPTALLPSPSVPTGGFNCDPTNPNLEAARILSNQMIESLDRELGRVMVETGLAMRKADGSLDYHPETTDTMVVIVGDNGTYAPGVKAPFDPPHSKGTPYQTGVWVPLIVAGPLVKAPDRDVPHMVNVTDFFELFGEIAGVDVHKVVPKSHVLDSASMLPYLTNPDQGSIRKTNFTQTGVNITANGERPAPCVLNITDPPTCVQLFPQQQLCEFEGGDWYGPPDPGKSQPNMQYQTCCQVSNAGLYSNLTILPDSATAIRNDSYKLVQNEISNCSTGKEDLVTEFYQINEDVPIPRIDRPVDGKFFSANNLLSSPDLPPQGLDPGQLWNFNALLAAQQALLGSEVTCPGDGNLDKEVNPKDLLDWQFFATLSKWGSSWYDLNFDGLTDHEDLKIIEQNLGTDCLKKTRVSHVTGKPPQP